MTLKQEYCKPIPELWTVLVDDIHGLYSDLQAEYRHLKNLNNLEFLQKTYTVCIQTCQCQAEYRHLKSLNNLEFLQKTYTVCIQTCLAAYRHLKSLNNLVLVEDIQFVFRPVRQNIQTLKNLNDLDGIYLIESCQLLKLV